MKYSKKFYYSNGKLVRLGDILTFENKDWNRETGVAVYNKEFRMLMVDNGDTILSEINEDTDNIRKIGKIKV